MCVWVGGWCVGDRRGNDLRHRVGSKDVTPQIVTASSTMHASMLLLVLALYLNAPRNICPNGDHKGNLSKLPPDCHLDYCCIIL